MEHSCLFEERVSLTPRESERMYSFKLNSKLSELNPLDILRLINFDNLGKIEVNGDLKVGKFYFKKKFPVNYIDKVKIFN